MKKLVLQLLFLTLGLSASGQSLVGTITNGDGGALPNPKGVFVTGGYAYVPNANGTLAILDVTNPLAPVRKGIAANGTGGVIMPSPTSVFVAGSYAYVTYYGGLEILDISNSLNPIHKGNLPNGTGGANINAPSGLFVSGAYAYIASSSGAALEIVDVSNPASPIHKGVITNGTGGAALSNPSSVTVVGNTAFVTSYNALEIVDVSDPAAPVHRGKIQNSPTVPLNSPVSVAVSGNYAYVACSFGNTLEIVDITFLNAPTHKGALTTGLSMPSSVKVVGNYAYVSNSTVNTVSVVDVSNPINPVVSSTLTGGTFPVSLSVSGTYLYAATTSTTKPAVDIYDISNPATPIYKLSYVNDGVQLSNGGVSSFAVSGNYAYAPSYWTDAIEIIDITNPSAPAHKTNFPNGMGGAVFFHPTSAQLVGSYLYVINENSLEVVNVSNPAFPTHTMNLANGSGGAVFNLVTSMAISGNYAFITSATANALEILDISNPAAPTHLNTVFNGGAGGAIINDPRAITISGSYAYVINAHGNSLEVINISNPSSPVHTANIPNGAGGAQLGYPTCISISGSNAYIACAIGPAFEILDLSNPALPTHKASLAGVGGYSSIHVSNGLAYVTNSGAGVHVVDVSNPATPYISTSFSTTAGSALNFITRQGNYLYLLSNTNLGIYQIPPTIRSFTPTSGPVGTLVTISGANFSGVPGGNTVSFNGTPATVTTSSVNSITTTVPAGATNGPISVTAGLTSTSSTNFTVIPTITITSPASGVYGGTIPLTFSGSSGAVTYSVVNNTGTATVTGSTLNLTGAGTVTVTANVAATASYGAASATQVVTITRVTPAVTITSGSTGTYGATLNLTASAGGSPGALTYSVVNGTGAATLSGSVLTFTAAGTVMVTATVAASTNYTTATSATQTITIGKKTPNVVITSPSSGTYLGTINLVTSMDGSPGSLTYSVVNNTGAATLSGAILTLTGAGTVLLTANVSATANYNATSVVQTVTINKATPVITMTSGTSGTFLTSIGLTCNKGGSTGSVTYSVVNGPGAAVVAGSSTLVLTGAGTVRVTASVAADANYVAANSAPQTVTINKATPSVTMTSTSSTSFNAPITLNSSTNSTGVVSYSVVNGTGSATISGNILTPTGTGTVSVTANVAADANYNAVSSTPQTITISKAPQMITFTSPGSVCLGATKTLTATSTSGLTVSFATLDATKATVAGSSVTGVAAGSVSITANQAGNANYLPASQVTQTLTVNPLTTITTHPSTTGQLTCPNSATSALIVAASGASVTYQWYKNTTSSNSGGTLISGATSSSYTPPSTTVGTLYYYAIATGTCGTATSNSSGAITISTTYPAVTVSSNVMICSGQSTTLTAGGASTYSWSPTTGLNTTTGSSVVATPALTTTYTVTGTNASGCTGTNAVTVTISQYAQSISFGALPTKTYGDGPFTISASASSGLGVTFGSSNTSVAQVSGNTITIAGAGSAIITAYQSGNSCFLAGTPVGQTLNVNKANQTVNFSPPTQICDGNPFTLSASTSSGLGNFSFTSNHPEQIYVSGSTAYPYYGAASLQAYEPGNQNYNAAWSSPVSVAVGPTWGSISQSCSLSSCGYAWLSAGEGGSSYYWSDGAGGRERYAYYSGNYTVTYFWNGCWVSASTYVDECNGCEPQRVASDDTKDPNVEDDSNHLFGVSPNPASDKVLVTLSRVAQEDSPVSINELTGKPLIQGVIEKGKREKQFPIGDLPPGMYIVIIKDVKNERYRKLVIAR